MALKAQYNFAPGISIPVYVRVARVFGGKYEGWGSLVKVYAGSDTPEANAQTATPDFNGPNVPYDPEVRGYAGVYAALKEVLIAAERYTELEDC